METAPLCHTSRSSHCRPIPPYYPWYHLSRAGRVLSWIVEPVLYNPWSYKPLVQYCIYIYKPYLATLHSQFPPAKTLDSDFGSEILLPWTYQYFGGACDTSPCISLVLIEVQANSANSSSSSFRGWRSVCRCDIEWKSLSSHGMRFTVWILDLWWQSNQLMFILVSPQYGSVLHETNVSKVTVSFTDLASLQ